MSPTFSLLTHHTLQAEIDEALAGKKYKLCDELNADLQELQVSLASIPTVAAGKLNYF